MLPHRPVPTPWISPRWLAIMIFVGLPWLLIYLILRAPNIPSEMAEKDRIFRQRALVDTVVVGDSRVERLSEDEFRQRGWAFFNMATSGVSPEDVAMTLKYALNRGTIRRVVMGVSFENMTESVPFEFSRLLNEPSLAGEGIREFAGYSPATVTSHASPWPGLRTAAHIFILPYDRAAPRFHMLLQSWGIQPVPPVFLENGDAAYLSITAAIAKGSHDFRHERDPKPFFDGIDAEQAYQRHGQLSASAQAVYRNLFQAMERQRIPMVVFETGRVPEYQQLLDADPSLKRLQGQWRAFYRGQQGACVRFVDQAELKGVYDPADFFDAIHFMGATEHRLSELLAERLKSTEENCRSAEAVSSPAMQGR